MSMYLLPFEISASSAVSDIVSRDYRTADVFRRYGIPYCCGAKWPLDMACEMHGVEYDQVRNSLERSILNIRIAGPINFDKWETAFLMDYIINIHHHYLNETLPQTRIAIHDFVKEHRKKYPWLDELEKEIELLADKLLATIRTEEEVVFPYIRQLIHVHKHKEPFAAILIRTLRKPIEEMLLKSHSKNIDIILSIRKLTNLYTTPENACISHKVVLAKLKELDDDLMQHFFLEKDVLFPRALKMEKEVLNLNV